MTRQSRKELQLPPLDSCLMRGGERQLKTVSFDLDKINFRHFLLKIAAIWINRSYAHLDIKIETAKNISLSLMLDKLSALIKVSEGLSFVSLSGRALTYKRVEGLVDAACDKKNEMVFYFYNHDISAIDITLLARFIVKAYRTREVNVQIRGLQGYVAYLKREEAQVDPSSLFVRKGRMRVSLFQSKWDYTAELSERSSERNSTGGGHVFMPPIVGSA